MIKIYHKTKDNNSLKRLKEFKRFSWIMASHVTEQELQELSKRFDISMETLQDSLDDNELPRLKKENKNVIVLLRAAVFEDNKYQTTPVTIIINPQYIITISKEKINVIEDIIAGVVDVNTTQKSKFLISIALRILFYYENYINSISRKVKSKQRQLKNIDKNDIIELVLTEEILNSFVDSLSRNISIVNKILSHNYINLYEQDKVLIDDLIVDGEQVLDLCKTNLKTISNIREGYSTVLSMRLNQIMKVLTYVTAFFTIPMVITSFYGMNVELPLADQAIAFLYIIAIVAIALLIAGIAFIIFKRKL